MRRRRGTREHGWVNQGSTVHAWDPATGYLFDARCPRCTTSDRTLKRRRWKANVKTRRRAARAPQRELIALIASQARDMKRGRYQPPQRFGGSGGRRISGKSTTSLDGLMWGKHGDYEEPLEDARWRRWEDMVAYS